jgi:hypothetical protein
VHLPDVAIAKRLVSTEVAPVTDAAAGVTDLGDGTRNTAAQIVQGEYATFEYSATIPAHTTVKGAVLSDGGALALQNGSVIRGKERVFKMGLKYFFNQFRCLFAAGAVSQRNCILHSFILSDVVQRFLAGEKNP